LHVYANEKLAASTEGHDLDLEHLLSGDHTIYLYAPAHQQRLLRPLFEAITQQVVAAAQEQAARSPDGLLNPRLGLFLDEAGNCAALSDLDVLATTARGQGIQLVTVWHDKSQLEARYGPKASTILNNHRAKLFLSGLADLSALELGAKLIGDQALVERNRSMGSDGRHSLTESTQYRPLLPIEDLRRLRPGEGVLLYGHLRPTPIRLRPFYQPRTAPAGACRGARFSAAGADPATAWPQDRTGLQADAAPPRPRASPGDQGAGGVAAAGRGPAMTPTPDPTSIPTPEQEGPVDPRPAWERVAYTWLAREVARGEPLDPAAVAREVGVSEHYVRGTLVALRGGTLTSAQRIEQLWRLWELQGGQRLEFADLARLVGVREGRVRQVLGPLRTNHRNATTGQAARPLVVEDGGRQGWLDQAACRDLDPERFFPVSGEQVKAAEAKAICQGCQVRDHCLDLAVNATSGLDHDHGVFGGTLPEERSPLRGNRFPEPSAYRQHRELAEAAHQLANQVGLRQAAKRLGIHRDALKAAFTQWGLPTLERRHGWQPTRFLVDRARG
jgi:TraM recognition site of TraD and TraG/Transcription factor WhiB